MRECSIRGLWIVGGKRLVNSTINSCIKCEKLRGQQQVQKMADLPKARLTPAPPFSYVGFDVFGLWLVRTRRTRGGVVNNKCWAVLLTCMTTRAIHIELIESMDTSSFINALRRFLAIWGPAIQVRFDCGTNFTGAYNKLQFCLETMNNPTVQSNLSSSSPSTLLMQKSQILKAAPGKFSQADLYSRQRHLELVWGLWGKGYGINILENGQKGVHFRGARNLPP